MRIMKLALAAVFAVLAFSAVAAGSASAFVPLFLNEGGKAELLFSGEGGPATLRALNASVLGTILCEKVLVHGFTLDKSTLAHHLKILFEGKCELHSSATGLVKCEEPIHVNESSGELGLVLGNKTVGILVLPIVGAPEFVTVKCGTTSTTVEGAVIGEIPELNSLGENQYNSLRSESEQVFESEGKNSENQNITKIELLGVTMPGELKVSGFFGGKASEEATAVLKGDGKVEICTKTPGNCP